MSRLYRKFTWGILSGIVLLIVTLAVVLYFSNKQVEDVSNNLNESLDKFLNKAVYDSFSQEDETSLYIYDFIINKFEKINNQKLDVVLARAKLGKGIVFLNRKKYMKAIIISDRIINKYEKSKDSRILEQVAGAYFIKGEALQDSNKLDMSSKVYQKLIDRFKDSQEESIENYVAKGWYNQAHIHGNDIDIYIKIIKHYEYNKNKKIIPYVVKSWIGITGKLLELNENKRAENILLTLIKKFRKSELSKVKIEVANAYINLSWIKLLNRNYVEAKKLLRENKHLDSANLIFQINLAHSYLFLNNLKEAQKIYKNLKNQKKEFKEIHGKVWEDIVEEDFQKFEERNQCSSYFNVIRVMIGKSKMPECKKN